MRPGLKWTLLVIGMAAALLGISAIALAVHLRRVRTDAEGFRGELVHLQVPDSTAADARSLAQRYARYLKKSDCNGTNCQFSFQFSNSLLWQVTNWAWKIRIPLWRVPIARRYVWGADILTQGDRVSFISGGALCEPHQVIADTVQMADSLTESHELVVNRIRDGNGRPWRIVVHVRPGAPLAVRQRAYAYDLACLQRLVAGCKDASQLMPELWPPGAPGLTSE